MRAIHYTAIAIICCFLGRPAASELIVMPRMDSVGVYRNETRQASERPLFTVSTGDRLMVIEARVRHYLVKDRDDRQGWIEKSLCARASRGTLFICTPTDITAFENGVHPLYVGGASDQPDEMIPIERSFREELRCNIDKEEAARSARF